MNAVEPQSHETPSGEGRSQEPSDRQDEIERYLNGVRSALADLPDETRNELLEDLPAHLAEVASESPQPLVERLGTPVAYARELRAAAGLDQVPGGSAQGSLPGFTRMALGEFRDALRPARQALGRLLRPADVRLGRALGYERSVDFFVQLIPAWWVLRGYVIGMFVLGVVFGNQGLVPSSGGFDFLGMAFVLGCVVLSVRFGPMVRGLPGVARFLTRGATVILVLIMTVNALSIDDRFDQGSVGYQQSNPYGHIVDLYPYDSNGQPLTGVRLFDQYGQPITFGDPYRCDAPDPEQTVGQPQPGMQPRTLTYSYPLCPRPGSPRPIDPRSPSGTSTSATPSPSGSGAAPSGSPAPSGSGAAPSGPATSPSGASPSGASPSGSPAGAQGSQASGGGS